MAGLLVLAAFHVSAVAKAVKDVSDNHDADVMSWASNLLNNIKVK